MEEFRKKIAEILFLSKLEKRWQKVAKALAVVVVFCTTYMLILPAITLEKDTCCGLLEHIHEDNCYAVESTLICGYESASATENEELTSDTEEDSTTEELTAEEPTAEETTTEETTAEETTTGESTIEETTTEEATTEELAFEETTTEETTSEQTVVHMHTSDCYAENKTLLCTAQEHTHSERCFDVESAEKYNVNLIADSISDDYTVAPLAETDVGTKVNFDSLDKTGGTYYIVYTYNSTYGYYALDGNGNAVSVTVSNDTVTPSTMSNNLLWNFTLQSGSSYMIQNLGTNRYMHSYSNSSTDYGVTTSGAYTSNLEVAGNGSDKTFRVKSNSNYFRFVASRTSKVFQTTTDSSQAAQFYLAEVANPYYVWFDGTCGGIMSLYDSDNIQQTVPSSNPTITLPSTWKSPSKYDYVLDGWYDIKNYKYYEPGEKVTITKNTVFYADWVAKTYDVGQFNDKVVDSLDTNSFITTNMFDYSAVFNMQAAEHTGSVSATGHSEVWSVVQNENVPYNNAPSLGFIFRDWDRANEDISYAKNLARLNDNQGKEITSQITDYVWNMSGKNIIDVLFNPQTKVIGKNHVGEANYLYQFMDEDSPNYDGIHNGYYYYDATKNAASYNQTEKRFYIYNYLERTSDSYKDGDKNSSDAASGKFSDFLPFNSPYANNSNGKNIKDYEDANGKMGNYQYDAKYDGQESLAQNAGTNYWFGMKSEIKFYLPNNVGENGMDEYGNYGNISTHGEHMNFQFHGDDDMWVFIDDVLVMDVGGLHGIMTGKIDFSTGEITTDTAKNNSLQTTSNSYNINELFEGGLKEGDHALTIYYLERGGSQSNCAIYFNISPRYGMEITKKDALSDKLLDGAVFTVYTDKSCDEKYQAALWNTEQEYQNDKDNQNKKSTFTVKDGVASFWGISPGKVYYIKETMPPDGYPYTDDIIRVAMNNLGGTVCTIDSLTGADNNHTDGFDIRESSSDEEERMLYVVLTNQVEKTEETLSANVRVTKSWGEGSQDIPKNITVHLTADGKIVGKTATLSEANGWTYTWTGLPLKNEENADIVYGVQEVQVPCYTGKTTVSGFNDSEKWFKTDAFRDRDTFLIVNKSDGQALSVSGSSFTWIDQTSAQSNVAAQWTSIADGMGFYLVNGEGKRIVLELDRNGNPTKFVPDDDEKRTLYFYGSKLFAQQDNVYYYFSSQAAASSAGGLEFELYKKSTDDLSGKLFEIINTPVEKKNQTFVNVKKSWSDEAELHTNHNITVRLYADGKDTGRTLKLNSNNGWAGTFDGLLYIHDGSDTLITYTVVEDAFNGYVPDYSEIVSVPGGTDTEEITTTGWGSATSLKAGNTYRFVNSNGYALTAKSNNTSVSTAADNPDDKYQQWIYESGRLKNVGKSTNSNYYLYLGGSSYNRTLTVSTSTSSSYTSVTLSSQKLRIGSGTTRYINLGTNSVSLSSSSSVPVLTVYTWDTITTTVTYPLPPGYEITVNNIKASYVLPETGGEGTLYLYIIGGLLITLSAVFLLCLYKKDRGRRRKGFG